MRLLFLIHRYLGIGVGVLMALWCLSGIVMIYVPYPQLTDRERMTALPPIAWGECCALPGDLPLATEVADFQLEMLGAAPTLRLTLADGTFLLLDATTGQKMNGAVSEPIVGRVSEQMARSAAAAFGASRGHTLRAAHQELIDHDQWTVGGFGLDKPLHHVSFGDADGTEIYVSSRTGKVVQLTTQSQRFWGWLGAVPHWLYPSILRSHPEAWSQVVIWTSLLGSFLTGTGLYIGIRQLRRRKRPGRMRDVQKPDAQKPDIGWSSPYRGVMFIHHVPGLIFGLFAMTWIVSGLLSMNPWGVLESDGVTDDRRAVAGSPVTLAEVKAVLASVPRNSPSSVVSVRSAMLDGHAFAISTSADGSRLRFAREGQPAPLADAEIDALARRLTASGAAKWSRLTQEDTYYYNVGAQIVPLPAIRIASGRPSPTFYYLDALSGELVDRSDAASRGFRWWHSALHRLDFTPLLRTTLARTLIMLPLLLGAATVCATGAYLGIRRLMR